MGLDMPNLELKQSSSTSPTSGQKTVKRLFTNSKFYIISEEARKSLLKTKHKYSSTVLIFPDLSITKIEFNLNCLDISETAVESMCLTYDSTLNINLIFDPDVFFP